MRKIPASMRAVEIAAPGDARQLKIVARPVPTPGAGEVLIEVYAAGVNRPDVLQRQGFYAPPPGASDIPGLEVAGEVAAIGSSVSRWKPGDRVTALLAGGGYAEYAVAAADLCLPIPAGFSMQEAAALPETVFTVWNNLFERGGLHAGEAVLIHGGTSGIGSIAIQISAALGARVFATAGNAGKARACERMGAARGIDYRAEDFVEVVREETGGKGVDVILDIVAGSYLPRNMAAAAPFGRIVCIAALGGARTELDVALLMHKRLTVSGSTLRSRTLAQKAAIARAVHCNVWTLLESGRVRPIIHGTFPLEEAAEAHELMESSAHVGKIMLLPATDQ